MISSMRIAPRKVSGRLMQQANRAMVLNLIRADSALSRAVIARNTGLSPATVSAIVDHLLEEELVREESTVVTGSVGRRPVSLRFNPGARFALGIDLDVRDITAALVDMAGTVGEVLHANVPVGATPEVAIELMAGLADSILAEERTGSVLGVGVAFPGMISWPDGLCLFSPNLGWHDVPFKAMLENRLSLPAFVDNEVRSVALAEYEFGVARNVRSAVFVDVGFGVGGAVIIDGSVYRGMHGAAAEIGHNTVELGGPLCGCGNRGCLEVFTSANGLVARANEALASGRRSSLQSGRTESVTIDDVLSAAEMGDQLAMELLNRAATYLGVAVANMVDNWDPELVVLSGSVIRGGGRLFDEIKALEERFVLKTGAGTSNIGIARSTLGEDAKIIGAAGQVISDFLAAPLAIS
jgi:N-acetylglucosamine repressor